MCLLCEDENSYAKYLEYLEGVGTRGARKPDPDKSPSMPCSTSSRPPTNAAAKKRRPGQRQDPVSVLLQPDQ